MMLRIFTRDQQPRNTEYLVSEIERLVGHLLPDGYNNLGAVRIFASTSDEVSWQGLSTFGLREWDTAIVPQNMAHRRGRTGDIIYSFLMQHGLDVGGAVIEHVQRNTKAKKRTVQEAMNHDPADRFIRISDRRVAASPVPREHNPDVPSLIVIPDGQLHRAAPVLHESELTWLTRYVQALNDLTPPIPARVALTGPRAAGFAQGEPLEVTVVVDTRHRIKLQPRLAEIAAAASELVPFVRPNINVISPQEWAKQQAGAAPAARHNAWLPSNAAVIQK